MYVFLDSNFCYTDPFMQKNIYNRILLELAKAEHIHLYMSDVVREEILNNFEKEVKKHLDAIKSNKNKLMEKYLRGEEDSPFEWKRTVEDYVKALDDRLTELENEEIIEIITYPNDILPELVERSIKRIKPFTESKQEFRDAVIWLSYVEFAEEENLEKCYFITDNSSDFMKDGELHPELQEDSSSFELYKNAQLFIQECDEVKSIQKVHELEKRVEAEDYPSNPFQVKDMLEVPHYFDSIYTACFQYVLDNPHRIPHDVDTFDTEWIALEYITYKDVRDIETKVVLGNVIIIGYLIVEGQCEIYERNPLYERGDEEFLHMGTDVVDLSVNFSINLNEELEVIDVDVEEIRAV